MAEENIIDPNAGVTGAGATGAEGASGPENKIYDGASGATGAAQTGAAQTGAVQSGPPSKYELAIPKDSFLTAADVERISAEAKAKGLSNADAQALLERDGKLLSSNAERQQTHLSEVTARWADDSKADKEIGGETLPQNAEMARRVIARYGTDALKKGLEETGFGNHPELLRVFSRIGKAMSEDQLVLPGAKAAGKKSMEDVFYGGDQNKT